MSKVVFGKSRKPVFRVMSYGLNVPYNIGEEEVIIDVFKSVGQVIGLGMRLSIHTRHGRCSFQLLFVD